MNNESTPTPIADSVWDPDTRRILARRDEAELHADDQHYADTLRRILHDPNTLVWDQFTI